MGSRISRASQLVQSTTGNSEFEINGWLVLKNTPVFREWVTDGNRDWCGVSQIPSKVVVCCPLYRSIFPECPWMSLFQAIYLLRTHVPKRQVLVGVRIFCRDSTELGLTVEPSGMAPNEARSSDRREGLLFAGAANHPGAGAMWSAGAETHVHLPLAGSRHAHAFTWPSFAASRPPST